MYNGLSQVNCIKPEEKKPLVYKGLMLSFANSLDPDYLYNHMQFHLDPNCLIDIVPERFFLKFILKKISRWQQKHEKIPWQACKDLNIHAEAK